MYDNKDPFEYCYNQSVSNAFSTKHPSTALWVLQASPPTSCWGMKQNKASYFRWTLSHLVDTEDSKYIYLCKKSASGSYVLGEKREIPGSALKICYFPTFVSHWKMLFEILDKTFRLTSTVYSLALRQRRMERLEFLFYLNLAVKLWEPADFFGRWGGGQGEQSKKYKHFKLTSLQISLKLLLSDIKRRVCLVSYFHSSI